MPIDQTALQTLQSALGTGRGAGQPAPNGHTVQGALNRVSRIAQEMNEYGLTLDDLPEEKADEYDAAHEDLQFWADTLGRLLLQDLAGEDGQIELPGGEVVDLPRDARPLER